LNLSIPITFSNSLFNFSSSGVISKSAIKLDELILGAAVLASFLGAALNLDNL
jgi:hypothetical protein